MTAMIVATMLASSMLPLAKVVPQTSHDPYPQHDRAGLLAAFDRRGPLPGRIGMVGVSEKPEPPPRTFLDAGPAAYYSPNFDGYGWLRIYNLQVEWGHYGGPPATAYGDWPVSNRWCVHPDIYQVGVRLVLVSGGQEIVCTTGDFVREHHKWAWRQKWGIEVSWSLWNELADPGWVEVYLP